MVSLKLTRKKPKSQSTTLPKASTPGSSPKTTPKSTPRKADRKSAKKGKKAEASPAPAAPPVMPEWSPLTSAQIADRIVCSHEPETMFDLGASSSGVRLRLRYAYVAQRGYYPEALFKANQDALKISTEFSQDKCPTIFFGVFDGHGAEGDLCSYYVRDHVEAELAAQMKRSPKDFTKAYTNTFLTLGKNIHKQAAFDSSLSGTTAIATFLKGTQVTIANIGDSRAIVGRWKKGRPMAHALSNDQTPYRKDERERVKGYGSVVASMGMLLGEVPFHENWGVTLGEAIDDGGDPPRVFKKNANYPGCAFTRSLGDEVAEPLGVIADPEISQYELTERDAFLILASDGVWEFLTNQAVCDIVQHFAVPLDACRAVVSESYRLWLQFDERTDDITIILAFVDVSEAARNSVIADDNDDEPATAIGSAGAGVAGSVATCMRPVRRGLSKEKKAQMAIQATGDAAQEDLSDWVLEAVPKTPQEIERIAQAVRANFLFQHLSDAQVQQVYDVMQRREVSAGDVVIQQGEEGDWFYVVDTGVFSVAIDPGDGQRLEVLKYTTEGGNKPCFGELALMYSKPRAATVTADVDGVLWAMDRRSFRSILLRSSPASLTKTLRSVKVLSSLSVAQLQRLQDKLSEQTFKAGEYIITQGDPGDRLYLISDGRVSITRKEDIASTQAPKFVMELGAGGYFGERALLNKEPRAANAIAASKLVKLLAVSKETFEEVLGPLQALIDADRARRESIAQQQLRLQEAEGLLDAQITDFSFDGVTSTLHPCQYALSSHGGRSAFTTKCIAKPALMKLGMAQSVLTEVALLSALPTSHPMVLRALATYQDDHFLYAVLKARIATDVSEVLAKDNSPFKESASQFYTASAAIALAHLHGHGLIYRTLATDSMYLDEAGHLRLADFRHTVSIQPTPMDFCGYPHYLSPEQVSGNGHGPASDFWALGIVTYEMATGGANPWLTGDPAKDGEVGVYSRISDHTMDAITAPEGVAMSDALVQTLNDLLHPEPQKRIGQRDLRKTVWLSLFDWEGLEAGTLPPPHAKQAHEAVDVALRAAAKPKVDKGSKAERRPSSGDLHSFREFTLLMSKADLLSA